MSAVELTISEAVERGAQFYLPNPDGSVGLYYRWTKVQRNDGTYHTGLSYIGYAGGWQGSMERNQEEFVKTRLIAIDQGEQDDL